MRKQHLDGILKSKIFWAIIAELAILIVCGILRPDFFRLKWIDQTGMWSGSLIDIINYSSEITIIAMGMSMVIALGGTDLSVGSLMAVSGAIALKLLRWDVVEFPTPGDFTVRPFALVILVPLVVCALMGAFNGTLISRFKMQPIIATLVLMVAGRGIAQITTNGKQFTTMFEPFRQIGLGGFIVPMPVIITIVVVTVMALFTRKTSFGMFVESVGINRNASRVSGLRSNRIIMIVYIITGFLAGISGLIYSSRISSCDSNNAGLNYEMDAILAVVIGGTSMTGGKFSLAGTVVGSLVIRTITTLVLFLGINPDAIMAIKAGIIAVVIVLQSEPVRRKMSELGKNRKQAIGGEARA
ncbi:ABC transporter permease [Eubacteriales bacterium OttesenSCG-928-N13]|nr:ABC transporter permease [Eubacteriales bacterium OttesenSCG-928-N13]